MNKVNRDQLKVLFEDVKHFRIDENFDEVEFDNLKYYSFYDQTDNVFYTVYDFEEELVGLRWQVSRPPSKPLALSLCDLCKKHRRREEIVSIYTQTKTLPKNVNYRSRGFQICFDYLQCNEDLERTDRLDFIYKSILVD